MQCDSVTVGCVKCDINSAQCIECGGANFDPMLNGSFQCECVDDTFAISSGACQACSVTLPNCLTCSSDIACLTCGSGHMLDSGTDQCVSCSSITGCQ